MSNYLHRKDNRDDKTFSNDIKKTINREQLWSYILCHELSYLYKCNVTCEDVAKGGDGSIVYNHIDATPDKKFIINGKTLIVEIKTFNDIIDEIYCLTFKVSSLRKCLEYNSYIIIPNKEWWVLLKPQGMQYLLYNCEQKIYTAFSPNDKSIRIYKNIVDFLTKSHNMQILFWNNSQAKRIIKNNINKLFNI